MSTENQNIDECNNLAGMCELNKTGRTGPVWAMLELFASRFWHIKLDSKLRETLQGSESEKIVADVQEQVEETSEVANDENFDQEAEKAA